MAQTDIELIGSGLTLPNGVEVSNRLVKAAMEEGIGHSGGCPGPNHRRLYRAWADGGWGVIITGNVQVDPKHLATPHDRFIPDTSPSTIAKYAALHQSMLATSSSKPLTLMQLSHPGLQSSSTLGLSRWPWEPAVAPIAARPDMGESLLGWVISRVIWPFQSQVLLMDGWLDVVTGFVDAARVADQAGWGGVQIHSAHGYLLAEYLSPHTNPDPQPLPGVPNHIPLRLHLLYLILESTRAACRSDFVISVKINCSDFVQGGLDEEQAADIVKEIVSWKVVDILEVSGGTYASPAFASPETLSTPGSSSSRQSLFAHFTTALLPHLPPPPTGPAILLTGGLHDRQLIAASLRDRACDLVGIGRPACVRPRCPDETILNPDVADVDTNLGGYRIPGGDTLRWIFSGGKSKSSGIPLVGAGISTFWHEFQLCRIGRGFEPDFGLNWIIGFLVEFVWYGLMVGWLPTSRDIPLSSAKPKAE